MDTLKESVSFQQELICQQVGTSYNLSTQMQIAEKKVESRRDRIEGRRSTVGEKRTCLFRSVNHQMQMHLYFVYFGTPFIPVGVTGDSQPVSLCKGPEL